MGTMPPAQSRTEEVRPSKNPVKATRKIPQISTLCSVWCTTRAHGGSGLGLAICARLLELMEGRIWVESKGEGKGATFQFAIPI